MINSDFSIRNVTDGQFYEDVSFNRIFYHREGSSVAMVGLLGHVLRVEGALVQLHLLLLLPFGKSLKVKSPINKCTFLLWHYSLLTLFL